MKKKRCVALFMAVIMAVGSFPTEGITALASSQSTVAEENIDDEIRLPEESDVSDVEKDSSGTESVAENNFIEESEDNLVGSSDDEVKTGKCGDNLTWTYKDKVLTINGTGDMWDYPQKGDLATNFVKSWQCSVNEVIINEGVTSIGDYAFAGYTTGAEWERRSDGVGHITKISIPQSVKRIGKAAFSANLSSELELVIPGSVKSIGDYAFMGRKKSVKIENGVQSLGAHSLTSIMSQEELIIPDSVQEIGEQAFEYSCMSKVKISKGLSTISKGMFGACTHLDEVYVPDNIQSIGDAAFRRCKELKKIILPKGLKSIGNYAFCETPALESIELPESLESIGNEVFGFNSDSNTYSGLKSIHIPKNVSSIGQYAFGYSPSLEEITVDENNKSYLSYDGCLYSVHSPAKHVRKWQVYVWDKYLGGDYNADYTLECVPAGKTEFNFFTKENAVVDISEFAFSGCDKITSITIPKGVRFDSSYSAVHGLFMKLTNLKDVFFEGYTKADIAVYQDKKYNDSVTHEPLLRFPEGTTLHFKEEEYHTKDDVEGTITERDLFRQRNAHFLQNEAVNDTVLNFTNEMAALLSQKPIERDILTGIKSGLKGNWGTVSFMASYLISGGNENKSNYAVRDWCKDIAMELVRETVFGDGDDEIKTEGKILNDAITKTKKLFNIPDKAWDVITTGTGVERELQRNSLIDFLVQYAGETKEDATEIAEAMFGDSELLDDLDDLSKSIDRSVTVAELAVSVIMAREIEDTVLKELMEEVPEDSYLYTGLKEVRDVARRDFTESEFLKLAKDTVDKAVSKGAKKLLSPGSLTSVGGLTYSIAAFISKYIPESSMEDAFKACIAMDNSVVLFQSLQKKINEYQEKDVSSDDELDGRQEELKLLFGMYLTSIHEAYEYLMSDTKYTTKKKYENLAKLRADLQEDFKSGTISKLNFNNYLHSCLTEAKTDLTYITPDGKTYIRARAIANGNVIISEVSAKSLARTSIKVGRKNAVAKSNNDEVTGTNFISIPETIGGRSVVGLSDSAFANNTDIAVLALPDSVETIGDNAFNGCTNLVRIFLGDSVKSIGSKAFSGCTSLKRISIPSSVISIADDAFDGFSGTIYGQSGSIAEAIAQKQGIDFIANPKHITGISVSSTPSQTSFGLNEQIDLSGMTLSVNYLDGASEQISDGYEIAFTSPKAVGINTIIIVYDGWFCPLDLTLTEDSCKYTVHYVDEKGARIAEDDYGIGTVGESVNVKAKEISGYTPKEATEILTLGYFNDIDILYIRKAAKLITAISLKQDSTDLYIGKKVALIANIVPEDADNKSLKWTSNNEKVATVDENGTVTAIGEGEAIITATAEDGSNVKAECVVTVKAKQQTVDKAALKKAIDSGKALAAQSDVYTEDSLNKLSDAIKSAQDVDNNTDATQEEVDATTESLSQAVKELVKKNVATPTPSPVDKTPLKKAIEAAKIEAEKKDTYTEESLKSLVESIKAAQDVADSSDATQAEIDTAVVSLEKAINELEGKAESTPSVTPSPTLSPKPDKPSHGDGGTTSTVDKTGLTKSLTAAKAEAKRTSVYTAESLQALNKVIKSAEDVLSKTNPSQVEINNAKGDLDKALNRLVKKTESSNKKGSSSSTKKTAATSAMYRVYNPNSGEHFYTASAGEKNYLVAVGWNDEGIGWTAPKTSDTPIYRLYNKNGGEHHFTTNKGEKETLVKLGWNDEGIGWYSDDNTAVPLYRQYNPNAYANNHNYTTNAQERDHLISLGWRDEGIGWYGVA